MRREFLWSDSSTQQDHYVSRCWRCGRRYCKDNYCAPRPDKNQLPEYVWVLDICVQAL